VNKQTSMDAELLLDTKNKNKIKKNKMFNIANIFVTELKLNNEKLINNKNCRAYYFFN